jgi:putative molybdopterin biosynthesis protein
VQLLTTNEAAEYLRLKERKLYELVAENAIPCTKITGRWLFPKDELDHWLRSSVNRPGGLTRPEPMPIVGGSHDPLLEWALRESRSGLATLSEGSEAGLERFIQGELIAAAIHLHALDDGIDANVEAMRTRANLHDAVLVGFLRREQGLLVANGNPLGIRSVKDLSGRGVRVATRPKGAGAQLLLIALAQQAGVKLDQLSLVEPPCPTGNDVAQAIRANRADCGIAPRSVANAAGLEFVPLLWERFDIAMGQHDYFRAPLQAFIAFMRSPGLKARADELGGYDVSGAGQIRYAP